MESVNVAVGFPVLNVSAPNWACVSKYNITMDTIITKQNVQSQLVHYSLLYTHATYACAYIINYNTILCDNNVLISTFVGVMMIVMDTSVMCAVSVFVMELHLEIDVNVIR